MEKILENAKKSLESLKKSERTSFFYKIKTIIPESRNFIYFVYKKDKGICLCHLNKSHIDSFIDPRFKKQKDTKKIFDNIKDFKFIKFGISQIEKYQKLVLKHENGKKDNIFIHSDTKNTIYYAVLVFKEEDKYINKYYVGKTGFHKIEFENGIYFTKGNDIPKEKSVPKKKKKVMNTCKKRWKSHRASKVTVIDMNLRYCDYCFVFVIDCINTKIKFLNKGKNVLKGNLEDYYIKLAKDELGNESCLNNKKKF